MYVGYIHGVNALLQKMSQRKMYVVTIFVYNQQLESAVKEHFSRYADHSDYQLWLLLDNHDFNRFLYECGGDVELLKEAIAFSRCQYYPYQLYYGTEKGMTHKFNRFSGEAFADEQVRECMKWDMELI